MLNLSKQVIQYQIDHPNASYASVARKFTLPYYQVRNLLIKTGIGISYQKSRLSLKSLEIVQYRIDHPYVCGTEIAKKYGLSKQRIKQLLDRAGVMARGLRHPKK